ncbi:MAG TPA: hypothetical protein VJ043_03900 [Candidatus Paceibacterota bacterium]|nr:hypothetical protein [Candidatus Paceibacterota bacterium]
MTNATIEKKLATMAVDIRRLKKFVKINSAVVKARARLRAEIIKGLKSDSGKPIDAAYWKRLHALARQHASKA